MLDNMSPMEQYLFLEALFGSLTIGVVCSKVGWDRVRQMVRLVIELIRERRLYR